MILFWEKPEKVMSTEAWQRISADGAPPGVYTPNMSEQDARRWKARYTGGNNPRVEIRKTVLGPFRPAPAGHAFDTLRSVAQVLVIVDATTVRVSANGTADFEAAEFDQLAQAVAEARAVISIRSAARARADLRGKGDLPWPTARSAPRSRVSGRRRWALSTRAAPRWWPAPGWAGPGTARTARCAGGRGRSRRPGR